MSEVDTYYNTNSYIYSGLKDKLDPLIREILNEEKVSFQDVQSRIKTLSSFKEKMLKRNYMHPKQVNDLLGFRIICYVVKDVNRIENILQDNFSIRDREDKSIKLGTNIVGYRSLHLTASLSPQRCQLPEYSKYKLCEFEIQVVTILQHAWAEIEHDKVYKFKGNYPDEIKRRLKILSGTLEVCDNEFERITEEIKQYTNDIETQINNESLEIPISLESLRAFMTVKFQQVPTFYPQFGVDNGQDILEVLEWLNIRTLNDLDQRIRSDFADRLGRCPTPRRGINITRLITFILIINNTEEYFNRGWQNRFGEFDSYDYLIFKEFEIDTSKFPEEIRFDCSGM